MGFSIRLNVGRQWQRRNFYGNIESVNEEINATHTNSHYMKDWKLNETTRATGNLEEALDGAELVLFVLPTKAVRIVAKQVRKVLKNWQQATFSNCY